MKIGHKKPENLQRPVYVTKDIYEIWYAKPQSLGKIHNIKGFWYTADGQRHKSSHDAMDYLIKMLEAGAPVMGALNLATLKVPTRTRKPKIASTASVGLSAEDTVSPDSAEFQEFLAFRRWQAKRTEVLGRNAKAGASLDTDNDSAKVVGQ
jgi:hypothetical protein